MHNIFVGVEEDCFIKDDDVKPKKKEMIVEKKSTKLTFCLSVFDVVTVSIWIDNNKAVNFLS